MAKSNLEINKLKEKLSKIPPDKLSEIDDFIDFLLNKSQAQTPKIVKLAGIWRGLGFEKIINIEEEIRKIRKEAIVSIIKQIHK